MMDPSTRRAYHERGWWGDETLSGRIRHLATAHGDQPAFYTTQGAVSWATYDDVASLWARALGGAGLESGDRVAVWLNDSPAVHAAMVAIERAGLVAVGIGARAGDQELRHLLGTTGARGLLTHATARGRSATALHRTLASHGVDIEHHLVVPRELSAGARAPLRTLAGTEVARCDPEALGALGPDDLAILNSTSGTTGLPKCVMHTQNRWFYFHQLAVEAARLSPDDVFFGAIPAPFGFGLWTSHFTPTILGSPTVLTEQFDAGVTLDLIEAHGVTVLCCVSTQFILLLNEQGRRPRDLTSLRVRFTGGEAIPYARAVEFEDTTGAALLQFYGSNETGALSRTTLDDSQAHRLRTAGRLIDDMQVRLFDPGDGGEITGRSGQPGCRGPATCLGYWDDPAANDRLFTRDGWMLMGDIVEIDPDGYLRVTGRTSDFIIRGGKNISAPAVEEQLLTHPAVAEVAVVASPDPVFVERACAYVVARPGAEVTLEGLNGQLAERGVSKEWFPERLVALASLPRSSGGKVAKSELRAEAQRRFGDGQDSGAGDGTSAGQ